MAHHLEQRNTKKHLRVEMDYPRHFALGKYLTGSTAAFLLVLPNLAWIILDKGLWRGDPAGYALNSVSLYMNMISNPSLWKWNLLHGYKAPLLVWLGQFLVPLGDFIGSINFALLLIPLIATYAALIFLFRSLQIVFKSKSIALFGCVAAASSPLLHGLSTQFWIEPLQMAVTSWFIYAMVKAGSWNFYSALAQFIIALSLAMLTKVSSPLYIIVPAVVFWMNVLRSPLSSSMNWKNLVFLTVSLLFLFPTALFYFNNYEAMLDFARYAATSPLFGSDKPQMELLMFVISEGIFLPAVFYSAALLVMFGIVRTIQLRAYDNFGGVFLVALFQSAIFTVAWLQSSNADPRYFLPALPYFIILVCWAMAAINNRVFIALTGGTFLVQFFYMNGFAFGFIQHTPAYGMIRPVATEPDEGMTILHGILPLATRDSSLIFDLNPEVGVAEFQYELAKQDLTGNWMSSNVDISVFFNYDRQKIDTTKIHADTVWKQVLAYGPDFYITWNSRLSREAAAAEMKRIDKYNAVTVPVRWAIAEKLKNCEWYEIISFPIHPELLVFKRCEASPILIHPITAGSPTTGRRWQAKEGKFAQ